MTKSKIVLNYFEQNFETLLKRFLIGILILKAFIFYFYSRSHIDESLYLIKSAFYFNNTIDPYGVYDNPYYMPVVYYYFGFWQWLLGHGHYVGRAANLFLLFLNTFLIFTFVNQVSKKRYLGLFAAFIHTIVPFNVFFSTIIGPYSLVNFFTLLILFLVYYSSEKERKFGPIVFAALLIGLLAALIYFTRRNMIPLIVSILAFYPFLIGRHFQKALAYVASLFAFVGSSFSMFAVFGEKLTFLAVEVPFAGKYLTRIAEILGLSIPKFPMLDKIGIEIFPKYPYTPFGPKLWEAVLERFLEVMPIFGFFFVGSVLVLVCARFFHFRIKKLTGFLLITFFLQQFGMIIGSMHFAIGSITAYSFYSVAIGVIAMTLLLWENIIPSLQRIIQRPDGMPFIFIAVTIVAVVFTDVFRERIVGLAFLSSLGILAIAYFSASKAYEVNGRRILQLFALVGLLSFLLSFRHITFGNSYLVKKASNTYFSELKTVTQFIEKNVPKNSDVLVIGGQPLITEAIFLAGSVPNPAGISGTVAGKEDVPKDLTEPERQMALKEFEYFNFINSEMLVNLIKGEGRHYNYMMSNGGGSSSVVSPILDNYFELVVEHRTDGLDGVPIRVYLFKRKEMLEENIQRH